MTYGRMLTPAKSAANLIGAIGNDADAGNDNLQGGTGNDWILGGPGDDHLAGGQGSDVFIGDVGRLFFGIDPAGMSTDDTFSIGNDTISDLIDGYGGDDILMGGTGSDELYGGPGQNILLGDNGRVVLDLQGRIRTIETTNPEIGGADQINGGEHAEFLFGGSGNDTIFGNNGDDVISGDNGLADFAVDAEPDIDLIMVTDPEIGGNDIISGGNGSDIFIAGTRDDLIYGDQGDDRLFGDQAVLTYNSPPVHGLVHDLMIQANFWWRRV